MTHWIASVIVFSIFGLYFLAQGEIAGLVMLAPLGYYLVRLGFAFPGLRQAWQEGKANRRARQLD